MQTQTLTHAKFHSGSSERSAALPDFAATFAAPRRAALRPIAVVAAGIVTVLAAVGCWFVLGWPAVALVCGLSLVAAAAASLLFRVKVARQLDELDRLATQLTGTSDATIDHFGLDGRWRDIARRVLDSRGGLVRQLLERHAVDQKLELAQRLSLANQRRAEAIVDSLPDAVLVTNSFGELTLANPGAERLLEFKFEAASGKPLRQVVRQTALALLLELVTQRSPCHQRHSEELSLECGGRPRWFKVNIAAVVDKSGESLGVLTVLRDITSEKAALARSAEFVSAVSHEVKTPLASVKAYAEMLADGDANGDPETQQKFLNIIQVQTDRMSRLLESLLDIARIESGVVRVEKKLVSLNDMIEGGAKLMEPAAADKRQTIERKLSSLYLGVVADPDMMSRVVMNLISNAIKYTDSGGRIVVRSQMIEDMAVFEVEDTGRGIPAEAMPKLFQKFYRVKENANVAPGTGLGLSLAKHIIEEVHGGKIEVESQFGKGSIFRVKLRLEGLMPTD